MLRIFLGPRIDRHACAPRRVRRSRRRRRGARAGSRRHACRHDRDARARVGRGALDRRAQRRRPRGARHPPARSGRRRRRGASRRARAFACGRGRRDRARLLPGLRAARRATPRVRRAARARGGAREARRHPHARRRRGHARRALRLRRDGRAALLLVAAAARARPRARLVRLVRGQRDVQERARPPRGGVRGPGRAAAGGDGLALPDTGAAARPSERARERRAHRRRARACAQRGSRSARHAARRERDPLLLAVTIRAKKQLGQHFLVDENILGVIGRLAGLEPDDVVLEIGPGLGILTRYLADRVALVHAVEVDRSLAEHLPARENVLVHWGDALALDLADLEPPPRKLVSNLPYNVATPIVVESLDGLPSLDRWCVMVQREVADRFFAQPGTKAYGAVSVLVRLATERTGFHPVSRAVFRPRPRVDSALVSFRRRPLPRDYEHVKRVVEAAFSHRRKVLPNSLELAGLASREQAAEALSALDRRPSTRAEDLSPEEFVALAEALG